MSNNSLLNQENLESGTCFVEKSLCAVAYIKKLF